MEIVKAEKRKTKLRLAIMGSSGSGKTLGALLIATGIGGKIGIVDTEHGSAHFYANRKDLDGYDVIELAPPYTTAKYIQAIDTFHSNGYSVVIVDSLSHAWAGEGGMLDQASDISSRQRGNTFSPWKTLTPDQNKLMNYILRSDMHLILTLRSKQEYVLEKDDNGKMIPKKLGLAPIQRKDLNYEFSAVLDIDTDHMARCDKDRTELFTDRTFKITRDTGESLRDWLDSGVETPKSDSYKKNLKSALSMEDLKHDFKAAILFAGEDASLLKEFTDLKDARKKELSGNPMDSVKDAIGG